MQGVGTYHLALNTSSLSTPPNTPQVGRFKARVRIVEADLKSKVGQDWNLSDLFEQSVYITRLYVTRGIKLTPKDSDGLADPFMVVRNGKHKQNIFDDIEHYQRDTLNPNFYRVFELPTMVPGNPTLTIEVWDKDANGRQLIGTTTIDIENRLFSQVRAQCLVAGSDAQI